jgi:CelD/BcsL family acetyltransferase involved in cellulose biosynthesis
MITVEVIKERHALAGYEKPWDDLFHSGAYEPSTSFDWTQALLASSLQKDDELLVMLLKESGNIVGIIPIVVRKGKKICGISVVHAFPLAELYNTHSDLLIDGTREDVAEGFLSALFKSVPAWDVFKLGRFVETNPVVDRLEGLLRRSPHRYEIRGEEPSFFIPLGNSYDDFMKQLSSNFRKQIRSLSKKLQSVGEVVYSKIQDFHRSATAFNDILYIEENCWKHKRGTSIAAKKNQIEFFQHLCVNASKKGLLRLGFLLLNNEPIAYEMGLVKDKTYYGLKGSYHEKYSKESPSTILLARLIEDLIRDGITEYDFVAEPYEWQSRWTDELRWHRSVVIYNNTVNAKLYLIGNYLQKMKGLVKKSRSAGDAGRFRKPGKPASGKKTAGGNTNE